MNLKFLIGLCVLLPLCLGVVCAADVDGDALVWHTDDFTFNSSFIDNFGHSVATVLPPFDGIYNHFNRYLPLINNQGNLPHQF